MTFRRPLSRLIGAMPLAAASVCLALTAGTAAAQVSRGSDFEDEGKGLSTKETRAVVHRYAHCVVKRQPRKAGEAILRNLDNEPMRKQYPELISGDCLRGSPMEQLQAKFSGDLYRYALADALVSRELAAITPTDFAALPKLDHRSPGSPPTEVDGKGRRLKPAAYQAALAAHDTQRAFTFLSVYGECVVRTLPAQAKALLLTKPDSAEESESLRALGPALSSCMPEGHTMKFGRTGLRGTIAVNFYRLAKSAPAAATGTAG